MIVLNLQHLGIKPFCAISFSNLICLHMPIVIHGDVKLWMENGRVMFLWWWEFHMNIVIITILIQLRTHFDGLVHERRNSIANALESRLSCTNPSISYHEAVRFKTHMCYYCCVWFCSVGNILSGYHLSLERGWVHGDTIRWIIQWDLKLLAFISSNIFLVVITPTFSRTMHYTTITWLVTLDEIMASSWRHHLHAMCKLSTVRGIKTPGATFTNMD